MFLKVEHSTKPVNTYSVKNGFYQLQRQTYDFITYYVFFFHNYILQQWTYW